MNKLLLLILGVLLSFQILKADEGMWLPILLEQNMGTMTELGLKLSAEEIFSLNQNSVKDAIVTLDRGSCTAELISGEGLLLTNHHCGYGEIQAHSSVAHDYLTDGFWAMSKEEELPNQGKTASFLIRVEDVTNQVLSALPDGIDESARNKMVDSLAAEIVDKAVSGNHYEASVESMFKGNFFYLFVYEVFEDIRLVAAPPESIGKFGADTDNWMWPRHTGDFSMFRIYCAPDGSPAPYAPENVPYHPKHFLPISLDGVKKDDFAFIMGYPGSTSRFMTSFELNFTIEGTNTIRAEVRGVKQDVWKADMDKDQKVRIQYASKYSRSSNYWKYSIEQNKALKRLNVLADKQALENEFSTWLDADSKRNELYGQALSLIEQGITINTEPRKANQYLLETQLLGAESFLFAARLSAVAKALQTPDSTALISSAVNKFKVYAENFYRDYNLPTDIKTTKALLRLYIDKVPQEYYPEYIKTKVMVKFKGDVDKFVDDLFAKSIFATKEKLFAFLDNPSAKTLAKSVHYQVAQNIFDTFYANIDQQETGQNLFNEGMRLYIAGLMEMQPDKTFYPDANSTMRLTYGTVGDYYPADAVHYDYFTTLKGVMEKEDETVREFNVPARLKEIFEQKDYGEYGNHDGTMNVCFTTNNDITGGNSGSPVINGKGQLIGIAFDGNSEAMSGDIAFENQMQKCINVDIRYVLLIIDKFAGAKNLINEMTLVKTEDTSAASVPIEEAIEM